MVDADLMRRRALGPAVLVGERFAALAFGPDGPLAATGGRP